MPTLLFLEVLNVAARKWLWSEEELLDLMDTLREVPVIVRDPDLDGVAHWAGRGLTAYDASYVALAEELSTQLVTADRQILELAGDLAEAPG